MKAFATTCGRSNDPTAYFTTSLGRPSRVGCVPRRRVLVCALRVALLLLAAAPVGAEDCAAKCAALMGEFVRWLPAEQVAVVEESRATLRSSLHFFCKKKTMHVAAEVARAEFDFCQHAADRAAVALRERQAAPLAALAAACGTWVDWANHSAAVCGPTVADGKRQVGDELSGSRSSGWTPGRTADAEDVTENTTLPMCFATPTHNDTLDGSWVPRTLPGISSTHSEPCQKGIHPRLGNWEFANKIRCEHPLDQNFVPRTCRLPAFDAVDFLRLVGKKHTLWFVGDSLSGQMFATVAFLLSANPAIHVEEVKPDVDVRELAVKQDIKESKRGVWCFVAHGTRVCFLSVWNITDKFYTLMTHIGSQPLDTIVFNSGLHYNTRDEIHGLTTTLDAFLHRWEGFCAAQCARLIWRETTPQHFDTPGGIYRIQSDMNTPCVPLRPAELDIATARNAAAAETLQKYPRVLRLPVWHMLAQRPDAHDKPIRYKEKALKYDCTHWSMPGVVDETVHLLYSLLLAHSTVVPNPNPSIAGVV